MSEISINAVENIDEIEQIFLLITCTTKLDRYYRVTLHFFNHLVISKNICSISSMFSTVFIDISLSFVPLGLENFGKTVRDPF